MEQFDGRLELLRMPGQIEHGLRQTRDEGVRPSMHSQGGGHSRSGREIPLGRGITRAWTAPCTRRSAAHRA